MKPDTVPLSEAKVGNSYRIVSISRRKNFPLDRLAVLGIYPGREIHLRQRHPGYVLRTGETDVALDEELARGIYVQYERPSS